jgi:predicted flap endonuclease-1-like 5' DNA nuclease
VDSVVCAAIIGTPGKDIRMSTFFADYGLWLLIALLVVIVLLLVLNKGAPPKVDTPAPSVPVTKQETKLPEPPPPAPVAEPVTQAPSPEAMGLFTETELPAAKKARAPRKPKPAVEETAAKPPAATKAPVAASPPAATPAAATGPDDLLLLKGVGPKLNTLLLELGVTSFAQIAAWSDTDLALVDAKLGTFKGRPVRDHWIDQAKYLAAGDTVGFEAKYGKL